MPDASVTDRYPRGPRLEGEEETVMTHTEKERKATRVPLSKVHCTEGPAEESAWKAHQQVEKITRLSSKDAG